MLTEKQLAWCKERMPAFARSYQDVINRDESAAVSNARARGTYPPECVHLMTGNGTGVTALSTRPPLRQRLAAKIERDGRTQRA